MTTQTLSIAAARRIALAAQGFGGPRDARPANWGQLRRMIDRLRLLQIDSVNVCVRSHYMPLFSRLGAYDCARLDKGLLTPTARTRGHFEYWGHEASFLPLDMHRLVRWRMADAANGVGVWRSVAEFGREQAPLLKAMTARILEEGPLATREATLEGETSGRGGLWDWKGSKIALEYLFWTGVLTSAGRRGFERVYDLTERVIPAEILSRPTPSREEAHIALAQMAAEAYGIATAADLRDYFRLPANGFDATLEALLQVGAIEEVRVQGWDKPAYLARGARRPRRMDVDALLTPFDPLVWFRPRASRLFDFDYKIEIYTPAEKRRYGYYCLPFLHAGALGARVDLKADRTVGILRAQSTHAEPGCATGDVAAALAAELRRLAAWQGLAGVVAEPVGDLGPMLAQHLTDD
ncbi:MAG: crosslink repair DNA glycosylase YcaQ family protein [Pseudomonadota bacterium]